jgi:ABC-2 type transport system ATP-binding protein
VDRRVEEMSKGMQQKVQFIAALLHEPELIIMDEPFSGLDPINANLLKDVILELKEQGRTILFSTHRMDQVEKLCDTICLLNQGRAVVQGSLREIKASYGARFVQIAYEGDGKFLARCSLVESSNDYGNYAEVKLRRGADAQDLLRAAMCAAKISRFEVMEPSLEEIFIDRVEKANG